MAGSLVAVCVLSCWVEHPTVTVLFSIVAEFVLNFNFIDSSVVSDCSASTIFLVGYTRSTITNAPRFVADAYSFRIQNILRRDLERLYLYDADVIDGRSATDFIGNDSSILISRSLINSGIANSNYYNITAAQRLEANALADIISGRTRCYTTLANLASDTSTYNVILGITVVVAVLLCGYFVVSYLTRPDTAVDAVAGSAGSDVAETSRNAIQEVVLDRPGVESVTVVLEAVSINPEYVLVGSLLGCVVFVVFVLVLFAGRGRI